MTPSNWALGAQNAPEKYATHVQNGHFEISIVLLASRLKNHF